MNITENAAAVRRMQDYIEQHIASPITLHQLAAVAGYSPYHSAHMFRELTGRAPFAYIRSLRLSRAALLLRDGDPKILDVALDFVFDSHEGFTRAFSREFGISPSRYHRNPVPIPLFMPYPAGGGAPAHNDINEEEKTMSEVVSLPIFTQVIERPARKAIIRRGIKATEYFEYCNEVGCEIWGVLCSVKEALYEPVGMWLPEKLIAPGTSQYVQGVEVPAGYAGAVPDGFELIDLEPATYMVFQGPPYDDEVFEDSISLVWDALKTYDPAIYGYNWAPDAAPRMQLAPMGYRGYIELRPVIRKISR